ncbi:uncharacterized protein LOC144367389 [Ictidomys tridecemlineatus]
MDNRKKTRDSGNPGRPRHTLRCGHLCPTPGHQYRGSHQPLCIAPKARTPTSNSPPDRKQEGGSRVPCVPPTGRPQLRVRREEVQGLVSGCAIAVGPRTSIQRTWGAGAGRRGDFRGAAGEAVRCGRWHWAPPGARNVGLLPGNGRWARRRGAASGAGPKLIGSPACAPDMSRETPPSPAEAAPLVEVLVVISLAAGKRQERSFQTTQHLCLYLVPRIKPGPHACQMSALLLEPHPQPNLYLFLSGAKNRIQCLTHARQALYH